MSKLDIRKSHLSYWSAFEVAPVELWGAGAALLKGLLDVLKPFGTSLDDAYVDSTSSKPAEHAVVFNLRGTAQYRFSLGGPAAELEPVTPEALDAFPHMVAAGEQWVRATCPETQIRSHIYTYSAHALVVDETASDVLLRLSDLSLDVLGTNRGAGLTFHAEGDEGRVQLSLDHSLTVIDGLFLQYVYITLADHVDHSALVTGEMERMMEALASLEIDT